MCPWTDPADQICGHFEETRLVLQPHRLLQDYIRTYFRSSTRTAQPVETLRSDLLALRTSAAVVEQSMV